MKPGKMLIVTTVAVTLRAFLLPFARHYRAAGWRVEAAAADIAELPELQAEFSACHTLPLSRNPLDLLTLVRAPRAIRRLVSLGGYDIVHVHTPVAAFLVRFALRHRRLRPQVIYTAHGFHFHEGGSPMRNAVFRTLEKLAAPWCDALVTINREDFDAARTGGFRTRVEYMPGIGVDTAQWDAGKVTDDAIAKVRQELALPEAAVLFLMVAEFIPRKRHADVIQALAQLADGHIHLAFAGAGPQLEAVRSLARQAGVGERVHFLGFRRDISVLMRASRAVILPSTHEGLPRSLLEAMSLWVPFIGSDIRGVRELAEGGGGLLHAPGDVAALAQAIRRLADDRNAAIDMGRKGLARVRAFDEREIIRRHDALYADLLKE
jgi:glycosyltransferase involved in cell wall biosynthesis